MSGDGTDPDTLAYATKDGWKEEAWTTTEEDPTLMELINERKMLNLMKERGISSEQMIRVLEGMKDGGS